MLQFLLPNVVFATLLQSYELFANYASKTAIIFRFFLSRLLTYNLLTFDIYIPQFHKEGNLILYIIYYNYNI